MVGSDLPPDNDRPLVEQPGNLPAAIQGRQHLVLPDVRVWSPDQAGSPLTLNISIKTPVNTSHHHRLPGVSWFPLQPAPPGSEASRRV